jgi:hypothetical protein
MDALPAIVESRQRLPQLSTAVGTLEVLTQADKGLALELSNRIDAELKAIEAARVRLVKPLNDHVTLINGDAKEEKKPWQALKDAIARKIDDFAFAERERIRKENERQEKLAAEHQAREAEKLARQAAEAEAKGIDPEEFIPPLPPPIVPRVESASPTTHFETGSVTETWAWTVELLPGREADVPRMYCSPDLVKLRGAVKSGLREIPGCRVY